jgi:hypothetical protein
MLHQFGTKHDLMTHVVEQVYRRELGDYAEAVAGLVEPSDRLLAMCDAVWAVLSRPSGVAVLEILQGSRSDPVLAERLAPVQARIEEDALYNTERATGLDRATSLSLMRLMVWSARGLSIAKVLAPDPDQVANAMRLLRRLIENAMATGALKLRKRGAHKAEQAAE